MTRPRVPGGALLPTALIALVALLATLQYRWLGQVSEAERQQLSRALANRAYELTGAFDGELSRLFEALRLAPADVPSASWSAFAAELDRWRASARFPAILRGVYLTEPGPGGHTVRRWDPDARAFGPASASWPDALLPARARLADVAPPPIAAPAGRFQVFAFLVAPLLPEIPALLVPVPNPTAPLAAEAWAADPSRIYLIAELDRATLTGVVLPALAAQHFPEPDGGTYRLAVLAADGTPVFTHGIPDGEPLDAERSDLVVPFFTVRVNVRAQGPAPAHATTGTIGAPASPLPPPIVALREAGSATAGPGDPRWSSPGRVAVVVEQRAGLDQESGPRGVTPHALEQGGGPSGTTARSGSLNSAQIRLTRAGWRLVLQHGAGSLDAAVARARRRNLALSFGILGVLAAGVVIVVANARRSQQLAARQMDFVATVSHELRTPLAVIRSAAQNLSAGVVSDPAQARRYGSLIEDEGRRLTDMIEQVMAYAGFEGQRRVRSPRRVDIRTIVEQAAAACQPLCAAAGCALEVRLGDADDVPPVAGDEAALAHVVHNLISNAAKHGGDGRWVGVSVSVDQGRGGREVRIEVSDRGRGIETADLARLFEPFHRGRDAVARQVQGNGLGLSLVKRIVEAHQGRVTVRSAPGQGATFVVSLPAMVETGDHSQAGAP